MIDSPATIPYFIVNMVFFTIMTPPKLTFLGKRTTEKSNDRLDQVMGIKQQIRNSIADAAITLGIALDHYVDLT